MRRRVLTYLQEGLDWLLPPACQLCGATLSDSRQPHLCEACQARIYPLESPRCPLCMLPHATPVGADYLCEGCLRHPLPVTSVVALGSYEDGLREAVHRFKFRNAIGLQRPLGWLLAEQLAARWGDAPPDGLLPVPLHRKRLQQRGYNQSLLLAQEIRRCLNVRLAKGLLVRRVATAAQQGLALDERQRNVKGAFAVSRRLQGERLLLVDDVLTTGATVRQCAEALLKAGAGTVEVAVLARAPRPDGHNLCREPVRG
ncbi:MAG: amidophosphoribosyltransferase [Desulfuromonas sp.]|nr:MAG: amidophosphoribosyltransferase [Desulfuromonas sp.]